jgi:hypothetical protein
MPIRVPSTKGSGRGEESNETWRCMSSATTGERGAGKGMGMPRWEDGPAGEDAESAGGTARAGQISVVSPFRLRLRLSCAQADRTGGEVGRMSWFHRSRG